MDLQMVYLEFNVKVLTALILLSQDIQNCIALGTSFRRRAEFISLSRPNEKIRTLQVTLP